MRCWDQLLRPMYMYMRLWDYLCPPLIILPDTRPDACAINLELDGQPLLIHEDGLDGKCLGEINIESCWRDSCARNTWRASVYTMCKTPTTSIRIHGASEFSSDLPIWWHQVVHGFSSRKYLLSEIWFSSKLPAASQVVDKKKSIAQCTYLFEHFTCTTCHR